MKAQSQTDPQPPIPDPRSYTPKHLAEKILQSKSTLEACPEPGRRGEPKQVTVLFADVKGSMELAEQLDPEEGYTILDRFFQSGDRDFAERGAAGHAGRLARELSA